MDAHNQQQFVFDRSERMRILRQADVPRSVAALIEAIEFSPPRPSWALLAAKMHVARATLHRAIVAGAKLKVIVVPTSTGRRQQKHYQVDWARLAALPKKTKTPRKVRPKNPHLFAKSHFETTKSHFQHLKSQNETTRKSQNETTCIPYFPPNSNPSPPPNELAATAVLERPEEEVFHSDWNSKPDTEDAMKQIALLDAGLPAGAVVDTAADAAAWQTAERRVGKCGVALAADAIKFARANGWTAASVLAACEHFLAHRGAWNGGALYKRLRFGTPDTPADEGWPNMADEYLAEQRRDRAIELARSTRRDTTTAQQRCEREARERAELESRYGPRLDALDAAGFAAEVAAILGGQGLRNAESKFHGGDGRTSTLLRSLIFARWQTVDACENPGDRGP